MQFQNETQDPSTPVSTTPRTNIGFLGRSPALEKTRGNPQDDTGWVSWGCLELNGGEFKTILQVLAKC